MDPGLPWRAMHALGRSLVSGSLETYSPKSYIDFDYRQALRAMNVYVAREFARFAREANVSAKEQETLKRLADVFLGFSEESLEATRAARELIEVQSDGDYKEKGCDPNPSIGPQDRSRPPQG